MRRLSLALAILAAVLTAAAPDLSAQSPSKGGGSGSKATAAPTTPVNLNTASAAQLEALPGVGPSTAKRIIEYRQKNGSFKKIEELMNVKGIGEKSFLKLKPHIIVTAEKGAPTGGAE